MKYEVQISRLAVFCVLCTTAFSGAFGAASVRSLGGAGTYSGTSAAANGSSAITAARAGSMRVTPSVGTATSASSASKTATTTGRVATSPRLSIGKYLGSGTSVSGGSSIKNQKPSTSVSSGGSTSGGSMDPGVASGLEGRISHLENNTYEKADVDAALRDKQNALSSSDYIIVDNDEIYLDVEKLQDDLTVGAGQDGREVQIGTNDTGIYWQYADDNSTRETLIAWDDLRGEKGEKGDQGEPGTVDADMLNDALDSAVAKAVTAEGALKNALDAKADVSALAAYTTKVYVEGAIADFATKEELKDEIAKAAFDASNIDLTGYVTTEKLSTDLAGKADADASYTKAESDAKYLQSLDLEAYAKTEDIPKVPENLVTTDYLTENNYAKTDDIPEVPDNLVTTDYLTENNYAKTDDIPEVPENLVTTDYLTENNYVTTETITETLVEQGVITEITKEVNKEITNQIQEGDSFVNNIIVEQMKNVSVTNEQIEAPDGGGAHMLGAVDGEVQWLKIVTEEDID